MSSVPQLNDEFHEAACDAILNESQIEAKEIRSYIFGLLGFDEVDVEKLSPVKKTKWPLKDRRKKKYASDDKKQWEHDVKQAALRVVREGKPIDEIKFREGDTMKEAVEEYLLDLAGYEADE